MHPRSISTSRAEVGGCMVMRTGVDLLLELMTWAHAGPQQCMTDDVIVFRILWPQQRDFVSYSC